MNSSTGQESPASRFVAVAAFAATLASAKHARAYSMRGEIGAREPGLDVASMAGRVLFGPVVDDVEPVAFSGELAVDRDASTAVFSFGGSAVRRTGAFTFDVQTGHLWSGMVVHDSGDAGVVDVLSGYEFELSIDDSGVGTFSYLDRASLDRGLRVGTLGTVQITRTLTGGSHLELAGVVYSGLPEESAPELLEEVAAPAVSAVSATDTREAVAVV